MWFTLLTYQISVFTHQQLSFNWSTVKSISYCDVHILTDSTLTSNPIVRAVLSAMHLMKLMLFHAGSQCNESSVSSWFGVTSSYMTGYALSTARAGQETWAKKSADPIAFIWQVKLTQPDSKNVSCSIHCPPGCQHINGFWQLGRPGTRFLVWGLQMSYHVVDILQKQKSPNSALYTCETEFSIILCAIYALWVLTAKHD